MWFDQSKIRVWFDQSKVSVSQRVVFETLFRPFRGASIINPVSVSILPTVSQWRLFARRIVVLDHSFLIAFAALLSFGKNTLFLQA